MKNEILYNVNGFNLTPRTSILKLVYSKKKIIELCNQYINENFGLELDFEVDLYSKSNNGESTTDFSFVADFDSLDDNELELLEKAGICENELLETLLKKIFNCSYWINISVFNLYGEGIMFELELPLKYLDDLKNIK